MTKAPLEETEQKLFIQWLRKNKILYFAPMNENKHSFTNKQVALKLEAKAKAMGKIKGVSDIVVMLPNKILFIELKRVDKSKVSKEQLDFLKEVNHFEYASGRVCYGHKEAIAFVEASSC